MTLKRWNKFPSLGFLEALEVYNIDGLSHTPTVPISVLLPLRNSQTFLFLHQVIWFSNPHTDLSFLPLHSTYPSFKKGDVLSISVREPDLKR